MSLVGILAIVLLVCAVLLIAAAEWPRLAAKVGPEARVRRDRRKRKASFTVIEGEGDDDFAASVERDLGEPPGARRARRPHAPLAPSAALR